MSDNHCDDDDDLTTMRDITGRRKRRQILVFGDSNADSKKFHAALPNFAIEVESHPGLKASDDLTPLLLNVFFNDFQSTKATTSNPMRDDDEAVLILVFGTNDLFSNAYVSQKDIDDLHFNIMKLVSLSKTFVKRIIPILPFTHIGDEKKIRWRKTFDGAHYSRREFDRISQNELGFLTTRIFEQHHHENTNIKFDTMHF